MEGERGEKPANGRFGPAVLANGPVGRPFLANEASGRNRTYGILAVFAKKYTLFLTAGAVLGKEYIEREAKKGF